MLNVGDYVGQINKDSSGVWKLYKDKINKITTTKKYGRKYFTKTVFRPLDADDVDNNTKDMEECGVVISEEQASNEEWIKRHHAINLVNCCGCFGCPVSKK